MREVCLEEKEEDFDASKEILKAKFPVRTNYV